MFHNDAANDLPLIQFMWSAWLRILTGEKNWGERFAPDAAHVAHIEERSALS